MTPDHLPGKLKDDAILEALVELRFDSSELPEVVVGRLADHDAWRGFARSRTPIADIPAALRLSNTNLKYQPLIELRDPSGLIVIKIGTNVISLHNVKQYLGWTDAFFPRITTMVAFLFEKIAGTSVTRIGLRYINALTPGRHLVGGVGELQLTVAVSGQTLESAFNLNYRVTEPDFTILTRVATPDFVQGNLPQDTSAYIDVDVFTDPGYSSASAPEVVRWIDIAHMREKSAFFGLFHPEILEQLREA